MILLLYMKGKKKKIRMKKYIELYQAIATLWGYLIKKRWDSGGKSFPT